MCTFTNSEDPDEMLQTFHQGQQWLLRQKKVFRERTTIFKGQSKKNESWLISFDWIGTFD